MNANEKYYDDILVRMAHNSTSIEGNTLSLADTIVILLENSIAGQGKTLRELYEVKNHKKALDYIIDELNSGQNISINIIKKIHFYLLKDINDDNGNYKTTQNMIIGSKQDTIEPNKVLFAMMQWLENTINMLENFKNTNDIINTIALSHIEFEKIHPFSEGNGRVGRMIILYLSLKYLKVPIIIEKEYRAKYIHLMVETDVIELANLLTMFYEKEIIRKKKFE